MTYFFDAANALGDGSGGNSGDSLQLYSVQCFGDEMDTLSTITICSRLVHKLTSALCDCLFPDDDADAKEDKCSEAKKQVIAITMCFSFSFSIQDPSFMMSESDHVAVSCIHTFLQVSPSF